MKKSKGEFERIFFLSVLLLICPSVIFAQMEPSNNLLNKSIDSLHSEILSASSKNRENQFVVKDLRDGNGLIIKYGMPISGYALNIFDTTAFGMITIIEEYNNNKLNGRRIQFFSYPNDTASIESFVNDTLNGPFYYNHRNGIRKMRGEYNRGKLVNINQWNRQGELIEGECTFNREKNTFFCGNQQCSGLKKIYPKIGDYYYELAADLFFNNGNVDSARFYSSYGYWGSHLIEIRINYLDSTRQYIKYHGPSGLVNWVYSFKIVSVNPNKSIDFAHSANAFDNDTFIMDGRFTTFYNKINAIQEDGYYENGKQVGIWRSYDENGNLTKSEIFE